MLCVTLEQNLKAQISVAVWNFGTKLKSPNISCCVKLGAEGWCWRHSLHGGHCGAEGGCEGDEQLCPVLILTAAVAGGGWCFVFCSCCRVAELSSWTISSLQVRGAHVCTPPPPSLPHIHTLHNYLTDDGPLSSFQGRSSSASSVHASLFKAIDGVMSLALCPQVASPVPQHFRSSEKLPLERVALPASLSARSFPFTPAYSTQYTHRSFWKWMSTIDTFQFDKRDNDNANRMYCFRLKHFKHGWVGTQDQTGSNKRPTFCITK